MDHEPEHRRADEPWHPDEEAERASMRRWRPVVATVVLAMLAGSVSWVFLIGSPERRVVVYANPADRGGVHDVASGTARDAEWRLRYSARDGCLRLGAQGRTLAVCGAGGTSMEARRLTIADAAGETHVWFGIVPAGTAHLLVDLGPDAPGGIEGSLLTLPGAPGLGFVAVSEELPEAIVATDAQGERLAESPVTG